MTKTTLTATLLAALAVPSFAQISNPVLGVSLTLTSQQNQFDHAGTGDDTFQAASLDQYGNVISSDQAQDQVVFTNSEVTFGLSSTTDTYVTPSQAAGNASVNESGYLELNIQAGYYAFSENWFGNDNGAALLFGQGAGLNQALSFEPTGGNSSTLAYGPSWDQTSGMTNFTTSGHAGWSGFLGTGTVMLYEGINNSLGPVLANDQAYGQVYETFASVNPTPELPTFLPVLALTGLGLYIKSRKA